MKIEHIALCVEDPVGMAAWYVNNLGMKIMRKIDEHPHTHFIADADGESMLEIYNNPPDAVPDYRHFDPLIVHIAFYTDDVAAMRQKAIDAGATPVGDIDTTPDGDTIAMLRDPWGLCFQFVARAKKMI